MLPRLIFTTLLTISIVEMCVRMIPPEEVSISTTASSLPTDEPVEVTTEGTATSSETNSPTTGIPVTDTPVTDEPTNVCTTCDISKFAPKDLPDKTSFVPEVTIENGCQVITVTCRRDDGLICSSIAVRASFKDQIGTFEVGSTAVSGSGFGLLECNGNGIITYNGGDEVTELFCEFLKCPPPSCTSCDISTIPLTAPPTGTSLVPQESTVDGCKAATVTCQRDDGQVCTSVAVQGTTSAGVSDIDSTMGAGLASAELTCSADGKYTTGTGSEVTALSCNFNQCPPPSCTSCKPDGLILLDPPTAGYEYSYEKIPGACIQAWVACQTTDGKVCATIETLVDSSSGAAEDVSSTYNTQMSIQRIECSEDGTWNALGREQVTKIVCRFNNCA